MSLSELFSIDLWRKIETYSSNVSYWCLMNTSKFFKDIKYHTMIWHLSHHQTIRFLFDHAYACNLLNRISNQKYQLIFYLSFEYLRHCIQDPIYFINFFSVKYPETQLRIKLSNTLQYRVENIDIHEFDFIMNLLECSSIYFDCRFEFPAESSSSSKQILSRLLKLLEGKNKANLVLPPRLLSFRDEGNSFSYLPEHLRQLHEEKEEIQQFLDNYFSQLHLEKLKYCKLSNCFLLSEKSSLAFQSLHTLTIENCEITNVSCLRNIQNLSLNYCVYLKDISPLANVPILSLNSCNNVEDVTFLRNKSLSIRNCDSIPVRTIACFLHANRITTDLFVDQEDISSLTSSCLLSLELLNYEDEILIVPDQLVSLKMEGFSTTFVLQDLDLKNCSRLYRLELKSCFQLTSIDFLPSSLRILILSRCQQLVHLPPLVHPCELILIESCGFHDFGFIGATKHVILQYCDNFIDVRNSVMEVMILEIIECRNLVDVSPLKESKKLQKLSLSSCNRIRNLNGLEKIPDLSFYDLREMPLSWFPKIQCNRLEVSVDCENTGDFEFLTLHQHIPAEYSLDLVEKSFISDTTVNLQLVYLRLPQFSPDFPYQEYQPNPMIEFCETVHNHDSYENFQELHKKNRQMIREFLPWGKLIFKSNSLLNILLFNQAANAVKKKKKNNNPSQPAQELEERKEYEVHHLGRSDSCSIRFNHPRISGIHCRLSCQWSDINQTMEVFIEDCSTNGTFILPKNDDQYLTFEEKQKNRQIIRLKKGERRLVHPMLDEIYLVNPSLEPNQDLLEKVSFVVQVFSHPFPVTVLPHQKAEETRMEEEEE